jgi:Staphylococcus phage endonuclease
MITWRKLTDANIVDMVEQYKTEGNLEAVGKRFDVTGETVKKYIKRAGLTVTKEHKTYSCDRDFFEVIDSEPKAYVLGLVMADGCVADTGYFWYIALKESDRNLVEQVKVVLKADNPIKVITRKEGDGSFEGTGTMVKLSIGSTKMVDDLGKLGVFSAKSLTIDWPPKDVETKWLRHVLRGYFDGNGSWVRPFQWKINSGSEEFIINCRKFVVENVGLNYVKIDDSFRNGFRIKYEGRHSCRKLYHFMYDEATIWLERKRNIMRPLFELDA